MTKKSRVFAFDFDGVISQYNGFVSTAHVGEPIAEVVKAIKQLKENGHKILIHSTRGDVLLKKYCEDHNIPFDYINKNPNLEGENTGKPIAFVYVDDRAVRYTGQSSETLVNELENFKAYWQ